MAVKPIPEGFHTVTPYLAVRGAARLIDFLEKGLGAKVSERLAMPDGTIMHAQAQIGDSMVMVADSGSREPKPCILYLYVKDADALFNQAMRAGGVEVMPMTDQFYGDRSGGVRDPLGNEWWFATHIEDLSAEELTRRGIEARSKKK